MLDTKFYYAVRLVKALKDIPIFWKGKCDFPPNDSNRAPLNRFVRTRKVRACRGHGNYILQKSKSVPYYKTIVLQPSTAIIVSPALYPEIGSDMMADARSTRRIWGNQVSSFYENLCADED